MLIKTLLHPKFKIAFLSEEERIRHRKILLSYIITVHNEVSPSGSTPTANESQDVVNSEIYEEDFYSFISEAQENSNSLVEDQLAGYLASKGDAVNIFLTYRLLLMHSAKSTQHCLVQQTLNDSSVQQHKF